MVEEVLLADAARQESTVGKEVKEEPKEEDEEAAPPADPFALSLKRGREEDEEDEDFVAPK